MVLKQKVKPALKNILDKVFDIENVLVLTVSFVVSTIVLMVLESLNYLVFAVGTIHPVEIIYMVSTTFYVTASLSALVFNIIIPVLIAVNILLLYTNLKVSGLAATPGAVLGLAFSGCPICTAGILSVAGVSLGSSFMPHNIFLVNIIAVGLLTFSAFYISSKELKNRCRVEKDLEK